MRLAPSSEVREHAERARAETKRLRAALERIAALHGVGNVEHQTVTLTKVIEWCREALTPSADSDGAA